jgi:GAF domain-containing protein
LRQRTTDLTESLEQQTATSEVLKVISSSQGQLEPVFQAMLENATRICEVKFGTLFRFDGTAFLTAAVLHHSPLARAEVQRRVLVVSELHPDAPLARMTRTRDIIQVADMRQAQCYIERDPQISALVDALGGRTLLAVPMLKENELLGAFVIYRQEVRSFTDKQVELLTNFAAQAVIAIENTRLLNELRQSLEQQTATSEVLRIISSSPGELKPVFQTMLENAVRVCGAKFGILYLSEGDGFRTVAMHDVPPAFAERREREPFFSPGPGSPMGRVVHTRQVAHIFDITAEQDYAEGNRALADLAELGGARTVAAVPMFKDNDLVGAIVIYRQEVLPFTDEQIELVKNFAAQAVIAIENTRLLNELRQRTSDLTESLEQQTATSEVLRVISTSPGEPAPVFDAMLENAVRLCDAKLGVLFLFDGKQYRTGALHSASAAYAQVRPRNVVVRHTHPDVPLTRLTRTKEVIHITDVRTEQCYIEGDPTFSELVDGAGARTLLVVPMLKENELVGAIAIYHQEVRPFTEKQIELVKNFAAQAVIAIENTRLLNELRQRTSDLTEALEQQTATSEVLRVISISPGDLEPVFQAMLENATRIWPPIQFWSGAPCC